MGLPQMVQSRAQFGYRGVILPLTATLVNFIGFNIVCALLIIGGLHDLFGWDRNAMLTAIAVLSAVVAFYGYDWMHLVVKALFWTSLPLFAILTGAIALGFVAHGTAVQPHFNGLAFCVEFASCASYNLTLAVYVSDYTRYLKRDTPAAQIIGFVFLGAVSSAIWLIALGAWLATRLGVTDGLSGLVQVGDNVAAPLGTITAFLSATALLATMGMNAYGAMLTVLTGIDSFRPIKPSRAWRIVTIVVLAIIWYAAGAAISSSGNATAENTVLDSLTLMLYLLVPWTALNLVDFFFVRRGHYAITDIFRPDGVYGKWGWRGLTAYGVGFAAMIPFMVLPPLFGLSYEGYIPAHLAHGVDYSWLVGLVVSGLVYLVASRSLDLAPERAAIEASDRELQTISGSSTSA
jgi:purine-cytosine permease-like protein